MTTDTKSPKHRTVTASEALVPTDRPMATNEISSYAARLAGAVTPVAPSMIDPDVADFISVTTPEDINRDIAEADFVAPVFIKVRAGQTLRGVLEARGTMTLERIDKSTGVVEDVTVTTYTVSVGKMRGWLIGAYELDRMLADVPADGTHSICVYRGTDEDIEGGRRVSRYRVAAKRVKESPQLAAPAAAS